MTNTRLPQSEETAPTPVTGRIISAVQSTLTNPIGRVALLTIGTVLFFSAPVAAQTQLGDVYCGTAIETLINTFFGAMIGAALPISLFYTGYSGFRYMRAGGNPDREREAKQKLYYGAMGMVIILFVLILPELADKIFSQVGFNFSQCVKPF